MLRALLIRHPHIDKILDGEKTWEIRGSRTNIRGPIALVASGTGTVIGVCELVDCVGPLTSDGFRKNAAKAGMRPSEAKLGGYRQTYAWVLANPKGLKKPVAYKHPPGAIIWVTLDRNVEWRIRRQLSEADDRHDPPSQLEEPYRNMKMVSVKYDGLNPDRYDEGEYIGIVVKRVEGRIKVFFPYESGEDEIAWLTRHRDDRWIDRTWSAIVIVDEASPSQRQAIERYVSKERLEQLLKSERRE